MTGNNAGVAQGKVIFERTEGTTSVVDKTFSFGVYRSGAVVITGHHSSLDIGAAQSTQYTFDDAEF